MSEKKASYPESDGLEFIDYELIDNDEENDKLKYILNAAIHVFYGDIKGCWVNYHKPRYAKALLPFIEKDPSLIGRMLDINDRVINMILHKALELTKLELVWLY